MMSSDHATVKSQKKPRPKETGAPVMTRFQPELLDKIDEFRRRQADLPNRPEAIRRLLAKALKAD